MYGESGVMLPCDSVQQFDDFYHCSHKFFTNCHLDNLIQQASTVSEYDLGGEGDLFKAPQPIIQQPLDPITIISCGQQQDAISQHQLEVADIQHDFLNHVFYECKNLLAKEEAPATESSPLSEVISFGFPVKTDEVPPVAKETVDNNTSCQIPKSISSDSLNSMDWIQLNSNFLNFGDIDFGMRRAFSEGDIKTLSDANTSVSYYPLGQPPLMTEDRMQKLSRYRNKKTKRNFGRKIKYACRKALADTQPRIRGRFAKTDTS